MLEETEFTIRLRCWVAEQAVPGAELWGPVPAPMARRAGRHRVHLLLQSTRREALHALLRRLPLVAADLPDARRVRWSLDIDPIDLGALEQKEPWYVALNPNAKIPTLVDHEENARAIFESGAILLATTSTDENGNYYIEGLEDEELIIEEPTDWMPENYTREFSGTIRLREALMRSINIPAIKLTLLVSQLPMSWLNEVET